MQWLERDFICGPYLALATSEEQFFAALTDCGVSQSDAGNWLGSDHANATAHYFDNPQGELCFVVTIKPKEETTAIQIAATLVHEAVHIFQVFCERIGEQHPSSEFEAYSIQTISQRLMQAYSDGMKNE